MTFGNAIRTGFANYINFAGRAVPSEFWYWVLFTILVSVVTSIVDAIWFPDFYPISPLTDLFALATLLPGLAVSVRRLHHTNRNGWWTLLWFIPLRRPARRHWNCDFELNPQNERGRRSGEPGASRVC